MLNEGHTWTHKSEPHNRDCSHNVPLLINFSTPTVVFASCTVEPHTFDLGQFPETFMAVDRCKFTAINRPNNGCSYSRNIL